MADQLDAVVSAPLSRENGRAHEMQAQLTRLQRALGVVTRVHATDDALATYPYGATPPKELVRSIKHEGDAVLVSLDITVERNAEGAPTKVSIATAKLNASKVKGVLKDFGTTLHPYTSGLDCSPSSPETVLGADALSYLRVAVLDILEPHLDTGDAAHNTNHRACDGRKGIILLLPNREQGLRDLETLGVDLYQHPYVIDIMDIRELYHAQIIRDDYGRRHPYTGAERTQLTHDIEHLGRAFFSLRVAVDIAVIESLANHWLRTPDQIDGGDSPGPWRKISSLEGAKAFVLQHDVLMQPSNHNDGLAVKLKAVTDSLLVVSPSVSDAMVKESASLHNYTDLIDSYLPMDDKARLVDNAERTPEQDKSSGALFTPTDASMEPESPTWMPAHTPLPKNLVDLVGQYKKAGKAFDELLSKTVVKPDREQKFKRCFIGSSKTSITCRDYYGAAKAVRNSAGFAYGGEMARTLDVAIDGRQQLYDWHSRLSIDDPRCEKNVSHSRFLCSLKEARNILGSSTSC